MIDRLRSHLKSEKGFTLIELLVVIAIIAILVVIVLVAINPLEQIRKTNDRKWESLVTQVANGVNACITSELGKGTSETTVFNLTDGCADKTFLQDAANNYISSGVDLTEVVLAVNGTESICGSIDAGSNGGHTGYTSFNTGTGQTALVGNGSTACS